jgi:hypothetical protein
LSGSAFLHAVLVLVHSGVSHAPVLAAAVLKGGEDARCVGAGLPPQAAAEALGTGSTVRTTCKMMIAGLLCFAMCCAVFCCAVLCCPVCFAVCGAY